MVKRIVRGLGGVAIHASQDLCGAVLAGVISGRAFSAGRSIPTAVPRVAKPKAPEAPHGSRNVGTDLDSHVADLYL